MTALLLLASMFLAAGVVAVPITSWGGRDQSAAAHFWRRYYYDPAFRAVPPCDDAVSCWSGICAKDALDNARATAWPRRFAGVRRNRTFILYL